MSRTEFLALAGLSLLIVAAYGSLAVQEPILSRDDKHILYALRTAIHNGYVKALLQGEVPDVQPVRDLSLWLDITLSDLLHYPTYHVTQVLLWLLCGFSVHAVLRELATPSIIRVGLVAIFLFHPVTTSSVAWIAARKHLLACFFLVAATLRALRLRRRCYFSVWREGIAVSILYFLAMASQPLGILWPIWLAVFLRTRVPFAPRSLWRTLSITLVPTGLFTALANHRYYTQFYPTEHGSPKLVAAPLSEHMLALGRYLTQLLFPVSISTTEYLVDSSLNVVGAIGFVLTATALLYRGPRQERCGWLVMYLVVLTPVTVQLTNVFGSDTYALMPLFSLCCLAADPECRVLPRDSPQRTRMSGLVLGVVALLFISLVFIHTTDWTDDEHFWRASYREGITAGNSTQVAYHALRSGNVDEALEYSWRAYALDSNVRNLHLVLPEAIYRSRILDFNQKLSFLHHLHFASPWPAYYGALLYAERGLFRNSWDLMAKLLDRPIAFGTDVERVAATAVLVCSRAQSVGCESLASSISQKVGTSSWSQKLFEEYLSSAPSWQRNAGDNLAH